MKTKKFDPDELITATLPARVYLLLYHFLNANGTSMDSFISNYEDSTYDTKLRDLLNNQGVATPGDYDYVSNLLKTHYHISRIGDLKMDLPEKTLQLNENLTAVIRGNNIIVGCETIPIKRLKELIKMIKNRRKDG